jgi:hypothetical protein
VPAKPAHPPQPRGTAPPQLGYDVGRQIPNVDNFPPLCTFFRENIFSCAQAVEGIGAGRHHRPSGRPLISTAISPCCAQRGRRVCTGYPQPCAQHDWTAADGRMRLS